MTGRAGWQTRDHIRIERRRPGYEALAPFFRIIDEGLSGLVEAADFFDTLAEDAVF